MGKFSFIAVYLTGKATDTACDSARDFVYRSISGMNLVLQNAVIALSSVLESTGFYLVEKV